MKSKTIKECLPGDEIYYRGRRYIILSINSKMATADILLNEYDQVFCSSIFDQINNDYKRSAIRYYINNKFMEKYLYIDKNDKAQLKNIFGKDKIKLLSLKEAIKYRNILLKTGYKWHSWLRSGNYNYADYSCYLYPSGSDYTYGTVYGSRAVRPALRISLDSKIEIIKKGEVTSGNN